jgi:hypothetical protein
MSIRIGSAFAKVQLPCWLTKQFSRRCRCRTGTLSLSIDAEDSPHTFLNVGLAVEAPSEPGAHWERCDAQQEPGNIICTGCLRHDVTMIELCGSF